MSNVKQFNLIREAAERILNSCVDNRTGNFYEEWNRLNAGSVFCSFYNARISWI